MSQHRLFLVHGMGVHQRDWATEIQDCLIRQSQAYESFAREPLSDRVKFLPITFDDRFEETRAHWKSSGAGISGFVQTQGIGELGDLGWLDDLEGDGTFFWTHVVDVLIYRFFDLRRTAIQGFVAEQLARGVDELLTEDPQGQASVLSHSLGTAVAHDAIHRLGTVQFQDSTVSNAIGPKHWRFSTLFSLANVSRILSRDIDPYKSIVRPGSRGSATSYCDNFLNFRHELDPFPFPKRFEPPQWGSRYRSEAIRSLRHWNPHGFLHYLENPRVHVPILRTLCGFRSVKRREFAQAVESFEGSGGLSSVVQEQAAERAPRLMELLGQLEAEKVSITEDPSFAEAMGMVARAVGILTQLRDELSDLVEGFDF